MEKQSALYTIYRIPYTEGLFSFFTLLLFALLPFHAFLVTVYKYKLGLPGPVNAWKEIIIVILSLLIITAYRKKNTWKQWFPIFNRQSSIDNLDLAILVFLAIGLISSILQFLKLGDESCVRIFYGFRYDFLMLVVFLLFRHSPLVSKALGTKVIKAVAISGGIVILFAFLQLTVLPKDILLRFGYSPIVSSWSPDAPPAIYHGLDKASNVMRLASTFAGPNQFGMYYLILVGVFGSKLTALYLGKRKGTEVQSVSSNQRSEKQGLSIFYFLFSTLSILGVIFSYSRSALLGMIMATFSLLLLSSPNVASLMKNLKFKIKNYRNTILIATATIIIALPSTFYLLPSTTPFLHSVFVRVSSSQGHWERSLDGLKHTFEKPLLGHGIGDAGPASARWHPSGIGWIPESWYLQVSLEYGLIGLTAWLAILVLMTKTLIQRMKNAPYSIFHIPACSFPSSPSTSPA